MGSQLPRAQTTGRSLAPYNTALSHLHVSSIHITCPLMFSLQARYKNLIDAIPVKVRLTPSCGCVSAPMLGTCPEPKRYAQPSNGVRLWSAAQKTCKALTGIQDVERELQDV